MNRKGQSTLEYAVILTVVLAALLTIQSFVKRGVEGKLRSSTDSVGEQYSAGNMTSKYTTTQTEDMQTKEEFGVAGKGISRYEITKAAEVDRTATGGDAEKIVTGLSGETLY